MTFQKSQQMIFFENMNMDDKHGFLSITLSEMSELRMVKCAMPENLRLSKPRIKSRFTWALFAHGQSVDHTC